MRSAGRPTPRGVLRPGARTGRPRDRRNAPYGGHARAAAPAGPPSAPTPRKPANTCLRRQVRQWPGETPGGHTPPDRRHEPLRGTRLWDVGPSRRAYGRLAPRRAARPRGTRGPAYPRQRAEPPAKPRRGPRGHPRTPRAAGLSRLWRLRPGAGGLGRGGCRFGVRRCGEAAGPRLLALVPWADTLLRSTPRRRGMPRGPVIRGGTPNGPGPPRAPRPDRRVGSPPGKAAARRAPRGDRQRSGATSRPGRATGGGHRDTPAQASQRPGTGPTDGTARQSRATSNPDQATGRGRGGAPVRPRPSAASGAVAGRRAPAEPGGVSGR